MFKKLVAIEPVSLIPSAEKKLQDFAKEVIMYDDIPSGDEEVASRIGDADAVLLSYTSRIGRAALEKCPNVRYIGMCCSLYSEESANVDIRTARELGIAVTGIRDYGDDGVVEFVVSELVRLLHGFGHYRWRTQAWELSGVKAGIIGLGRTGKMVADGLRFFGARVSYYGRNSKPEAESEGIYRKSLEELLKESDIIGTCLPRNTILLKEQEFNWLGKGKIFFNTSVGVTFDVAALKKWLEKEGNFYICDQVGMGEYASQLMNCERVIFRDRVAGHSAQCMERLSVKVIANAEAFLGISSERKK